MADITFGNESVYESASANRNSVAWLDETHVVVSYTDIDNSNFGTACVGVVTGNVIAWGTPVVYNAATTREHAQRNLATLDSTHFVIGYSDGGDTSKAKAIVGVVTGDVIVFGAEYQASTNVTEAHSICVLDSTHFVMAWTVFSGLDDGQCIVGVVSSGDEIAFGSIVDFAATVTSPTSIAALDSTHFVVGWRATSAFARIGVVSSGDSIAFGSLVNMVSGAAGSQLDVAALDSTHFVLAHRFSSTGKAIIGVVTGDAIAKGTVVQYSSGDAIDNAVIGLSSTKFVISYVDKANTDKGTAIVGTVDGDVITYGDSVVFADAVTTDTSISALDINIVIAFTDNGNSSFGTGIIGAAGATTVDVTIQTKARIEDSGVTKTSTAKAKIKVSGNDKTSQAKARIKQLDNNKTVSAKASIMLGSTETIQAKAAVKQFGITKTTQAKARIEAGAISPTISALAMIVINPSKTASALAMIVAPQTGVQLGTNKNTGVIVGIKL